MSNLDSIRLANPQKLADLNLKGEDKAVMEFLNVLVTTVPFKDAWSDEYFQMIGRFYCRTGGHYGTD